MSPLPPDLKDRLDHLVFGVPDLERGIALLEERLGLRAAVGGRHPDRGTRNAVLALGPRAYLEVLAPDPAWSGGRRWMGIDDLAEPRLLTWAVRGHPLPDLVARARAAGIPLGEVRAGARTRPDGTVLRWHLTDPQELVADGLVPFFIDWGGSPAHPAQRAPQGLLLLDLWAEHPQPERIRAMLAALALPLPVRPGPRPALVALLRTPRGEVILR